MGNEQSYGNRSFTGKGIPFVEWNGKYHFAEPSCYEYINHSKRCITGNLIKVDPPKADQEIKNIVELNGNIALVERGGKIHFADIMRKLFQAGIIGCIFIERDENDIKRSLYEGFHSSGRQKVTIPIIRLSKNYADELLEIYKNNKIYNNMTINIHILHGKKIIDYLKVEDFPIAASVAARNGETDALKSLLFHLNGQENIKKIPTAIAICDAVENGHIGCIELLHSFGISLNSQQQNGMSGLMVACRVGNIEAVRALVTYDVDLNLEDVHGMTALMIAAREGNSSCVKFLIKKGATLDLSRNRKRGTTALHIAARGGFEECLRLLIDAGAMLEIESPNSSTALMEAARSGKFGCVKILVEAGANITSKDRENHTAMALAKLAGHEDIEDFLRSRTENEDIREKKKLLQEFVQDDNKNVSLATVFELAVKNNIKIDLLTREATKNNKIKTWLTKPETIIQIFRHLIKSPLDDTQEDKIYGKYLIQHFCSEISIWYDRSVFEKKENVLERSNKTKINIYNNIDIKQFFIYLRVLFQFLETIEPLDSVILILFYKVLSHYIIKLHLGPQFLKYLSNDDSIHNKNNTIHYLARHIGTDEIRDLLIWIIYSDLSLDGQKNIINSKIINIFIDYLCYWQRTLTWFGGTIYQRNSIENIVFFINCILSPPSVYAVGNNITTFIIVTCDIEGLPLITDKVLETNESNNNNNNNNTFLFHTLLSYFINSCHKSKDENESSSYNIFRILIDLGIKEIDRKIDNPSVISPKDGGTLSIITCLLNALSNESLLDDYSKDIVLFPCRNLLIKEMVSFGIIEIMKLLKKIIHLIKIVKNKKDIKYQSSYYYGTSMLIIITILKKCIYLRHGKIDLILSKNDFVSCLLLCYDSGSKNNLLHRELTDIIRFILLDPQQRRLPSCPLLNDFFKKEGNILEFVMNAYNNSNKNEIIQYKGHLTTIANSILTLSSTPSQNINNPLIESSDKNKILTCHEIVAKHAKYNSKWVEFEKLLAEQNIIERQALGYRNAPLCDGCLLLKEEAIQYVDKHLPIKDNDISGYLETIFSGQASSHCRVNITESFITGFLYKKDKKHDHIPIPEPTRVSSFIHYPVPMPFHALTFTITYFGLCRKCDKLWYCDTLTTPNWPTQKMKWVLPTSAKKWYSFGTSEGPSGGAHGIVFTTKGYKNFLVLTDTWGRQEQWILAIQEAMKNAGKNSTLKKMNAENALAIEIDNEVEPPIKQNVTLSGNMPQTLLNSNMNSNTNTIMEEINIPLAPKSVPRMSSNGREISNNFNNETNSNNLVHDRMVQLMTINTKKLRKATQTIKILASLSPRKSDILSPKEQIIQISSGTNHIVDEINSNHKSTGGMRHVMSTPNLVGLESMHSN